MVVGLIGRAADNKIDGAEEPAQGLPGERAFVCCLDWRIAKQNRLDLVCFPDHIDDRGFAIPADLGD